MEHWMTRHAKYPERMSENDIFCAAIGNLGAGGDTLGSVQQAVFYYLLEEDPKHLQPLRKEIDTASAGGLLSSCRLLCGSAEASISSSSGRFSSPDSVYPVDRPPIKESLPLYPGIPWNVPRVVSEGGFTVAGSHFTEGVCLPCKSDFELFVLISHRQS